MPTPVSALGLAVLLVAVVVAWASQGVGGARPAAPDATVEAELRPPPPRGRLLVVLLDGARVQDTFGPHMPFLAGLRDRGAWGVSRVLSVPLSIAGQRAILAGDLAGPLSLLEDFEPSPFPGPSLVGRVAARGGGVALFDRFLYEQFPGHADPDAFVARPYSFEEYLPAMRLQFDRSLPYLEGGGWQLAVLPVYAIDYLGHLETPASSRHPELLSELDGWMQRIVERLGPEDTLLVTSEHGMGPGGFHVEPDEDVVRTPFLLLGPGVAVGGPREIAQVDLASTLSLLQGVSPFYPGPGIPALDLVELPAPYEARLLAAFAGRFGAAADATLPELRKVRDRLVSSTLPAAHGWAMALLTLVVASLVGLASVRPEPGRATSAIVALGLGGLTLLVFLAQRLGALPALLDGIVFSANWLRSNPALALTVLVGPPALAAAFVRPLARERPGAAGLLGLAAFHLALLAAFLAPAPAHPLTWILVTLPLLGWASAGRRAWLVLFLAAWAGLLARRLSLWNASGLLDVDRGVLGAAVLAAAVIGTLAFRRAVPGARDCSLRGDVLRPPGTRAPAPDPWPILGDVACAAWLLAAAAVPWAMDPRTAAPVLLVAGLPLLAAWWWRPGFPPVWPGVWTTIWLVGTSSRFETLAYAATFVAFAAIWRLQEESGPVGGGAALACGVWLLYLWPGNAFDLRLVELRDPAILGAATTTGMEWTVGLIAGRYLLPVLVLVLGARLGSVQAGGASSVPDGPAAVMPAGLSRRLAVAAGPGLVGVGLLAVELVLAGEGTLAWHRIDGLVVLMGWLAATLSAGILAAGAGGARRRIFPAAAHTGTGARRGSRHREDRTEGV